MGKDAPENQEDRVTLKGVESDDDVEVREYEIEVRGRAAGKRIDAYLASRVAEYSRSFIQKLIEAGGISVNGAAVKRSYHVRDGDVIEARVPTLRAEAAEPEDIPLNVIYEDKWIIVVNKSADMVVHPSRGHSSGTLVNALAYHCRQLSGAGGPLRPGIVHRLDKDTTGVMAAIKDEAVHEDIAEQFAERKVKKEYIAIAHGRFELDGDVIDLPLGKHRSEKEKMAVRYDKGRPAQTVYKVVQRLGRFTIVRCFPRTGRTHQIRVHLMAKGHPIAADALYSASEAIYPSDLLGRPGTPEEKPLLARHALHARSLTLYHPALKREMKFEAPVPEDMMGLVEFLRGHFPEGES